MGGDTSDAAETKQDVIVLARLKCFRGDFSLHRCAQWSIGITVPAQVSAQIRATRWKRTASVRQPYAEFRWQPRLPRTLDFADFEASHYPLLRIVEHSA